MKIPTEKQDFLGWALTKLRKFRISELPYFYNLGRELYSFSTSGFWNLCKWHSKKWYSYLKKTHLFSVTNTSSPLLFEKLSLPALKFGTTGGAVGWGPALQAGRSPIQFPMVSLEFFIDYNPSGHVVVSACNSNEYHEYPLEGGGRLSVRKVDILTTFMLRLSWNLGASTPVKPSGPVQVLLYFCSGNNVKWTNIVWAKCRACNGQHVYVSLLLLSFRGINAKTPHKVLWPSSCL